MKERYVVTFDPGGITTDEKIERTIQALSNAVLHERGLCGFTTRVEGGRDKSGESSARRPAEPPTPRPGVEQWCEATGRVEPLRIVRPLHDKPSPGLTGDRPSLCEAILLHLALFAGWLLVGSIIVALFTWIGSL